MSLTANGNRPERRVAGFAALDRFVEQHPGDPVVWTLAPLLRAYYKDRPALEPVGAGFPRRSVAIRLAMHVLKALRRPSWPDYVLAGRVLFVMDTSRHRWVLDPILRAAPGEEPAKRVEP